MKNPNIKNPLLTAMALMLAVSTVSRAANGIWAGGGADGGWTTTGNWLGDIAPGVADGTTVNTDTALFTNNPTQKILTVDANRNLANFTFDAGAGVFTVGGAGANLGNPLLLTSGGKSLITANLTSGAGGYGQRLFNAPLVLEGNGGSYTFESDAPSAVNGSAVGIGFGLNGAVSGVSAAGNTTLLNLTGTQAGWDSVHAASGNLILGMISDGTGGGTLGITKSGPGTWCLADTNSYTGPTTITGGKLEVSWRFNGLTTSSNFYIVNPSSQLVFSGAGGTLQSKIGNTYIYTNKFSSLNLIAGQAITTNARTTGGTGNWIFGALNRSVGANFDIQKGGSGNYYVPSGTVTNLPLDSRGVAYLTAENFADWAGYNTATTLNSGSYTKFYSTATGLVSNAVITNLTFSTTTLAASTNIISLLDVANQATTINLGGFTLTNGGTLVSSAVATAGSGIINGTLVGPSSGADVVILQNSAQPFTVSAVIANNGSPSALTKGAAGILTLTAANTYSGPTYINAGTLQLGNGGTSGSINSSSTVTNHGSLVFNRSDATTFALVINGIGNITNAGSGAVTLTADSGYTGTTVINSGTTLNLGNGGTSGSASNSAAIINNGTLNVNLSGTVSYGGVISGNGTLANQGPGKTVLNGTNTYGGNTLVVAGTLALGTNAFITNSTAIVISGGATLDVSSQTNFALNGSLLPNGQILAGTGTVLGSVNANGACVITPATNGTYGTLTVSSNLTLNGGALKFDVSTTSKDRLNVGGVLNLQSGSLTVNLPGGSIPNGSYQLINYTNGLLGDVANITVVFPGGTQVASLSSATTNWITLIVSSANPNNLAWQGTDPTNPSWWDVSTTTNWTNGSTPSVFSQNDNARFDDTATTYNVDIRQSVSPGQVVVNSTAAYTLQTSLAGKISGSASLVKSNSSTLTILTTNDYSGTTTIAAGTLQVGNGSVGARLGSGNITNNAALVYNSPDSQIVGSTISGGGSLTVSAGTVILFANNTLTGNTTNAVGTTLQLGLNGAAGSLGSGNLDDEGGLIIDRSDTPTFNNVISGAGGVTNNGSGTVTLGGANSYGGATFINNGTVKLGNPSALGAGLLTMNGGAAAAGILDLNGFDLTLGSLAGANGAVLPQIRNNGGVGVNTLTVNLPSNLTFYGGIADNTGSGGKIALVDLGPGTLTMNSANTYSGGTMVRNATLALGNATAAGTGLITLSNATLNLTAGVGYANTINVQSNSTNTLSGVNGGTLNGVITNSGTLNIIPPASGAFNLLAAWPNFTGTIVLGTSATGPRLLVGSTGAPKAVWDLGTGYAFIYTREGGTVDMGALTSSSTGTALYGSSVQNNGIYRIGALNLNTAFSGSINNYAPGALNTSVTCGITKVGTGTLTLDGSLNYSGPTTVSAGTLAIGSVNNPSASLDNSLSLTVSSNAVLDVSGRSDGTLNLGNSVAQSLTGSGTIFGSLLTAANGATISPGDTTGTLSVTNAVDIESGATVIMELNRTNSQTSDQIAATNAIVVNGGSLVVTNRGPDLVTGDVFKLFNKGITGTGFTSISLPASNVLNTVQYVFETNLVTAGSSPAGTIKVLQGASPVASYPTNITATVSGNTITVAWPATHLGWLLEAQTNSLSVGLGGNWVTNFGTASVTSTNYTINPNNGAVFYRLVHP